MTETVNFLKEKLRFFLFSRYEYFSGFVSMKKRNMHTYLGRHTYIILILTLNINNNLFVYALIIWNGLESNNSYIPNNRRM